MLTGSRRLRRGFSLPELLVSLTVAGVMLAVVTSIAVRQQRIFADLADAAALRAQLGDARAVLPLDLRAIAASSGDIRDARDTALEFRATIASAVVCDTTAGGVILAPVTSSVAGFAGVAEPIEANDTLWALAPVDSSDVWRAARVTNVATASAGACAAGGPVLDSAGRATARTSLALSAPAAAIGAPVRVTRPMRYSDYRASDGAWYLGERDWNNATGKFNTIQPVAGPFSAASQGGLHFTYLDSAGVALATPVAPSARVAAVRVDVRGETRTIERAFGSPRTLGAHGTDSSSVVVLLRNRR